VFEQDFNEMDGVVVLHEMSLDFLSFTRVKGAHLKIAIIDRDSGSRDLLAD
jgi:hypothetical protein